MDAIERLNDYLAHLSAKDLPFDEILGLKAETFEALAEASRARGDIELAEAEKAAAAQAWDAAATERASQR